MMKILGGRVAGFGLKQWKIKVMELKKYIIRLFFKNDNAN